MEIRTILLLSLCFVTIHLSAMEKSQEDLINENPNLQYNYRRATETDLPKLLHLISTQAIYDHQRIVILPKKFREPALLSAIEKNRMYIVENDDEIVGFKKLFLITDEIEKINILKDEIRCIDNEENCAFSGHINNDGEFVESKIISLNDCYNLCFYNGSDFTAPSHRGKGLNQKLTNFALVSVIEDIKAKMQDQDTDYLTMLYGITEKNAGDQPGADNDRTVIIFKLFKFLIQKLESNQDSILLHHKRYNAFMPTFDPESEVLQPLPDELSVPGFGCILTYQLRKSYE